MLEQRIFSAHYYWIVEALKALDNNLQSLPLLRERRMVRLSRKARTNFSGKVDFIAANLHIFSGVDFAFCASNESRLGIDSFQ